MSYPRLFKQYIDLVSGNDPVKQLRQNMEVHVPFLKAIDEIKSQYRYKPNKWSIKEVLGHLIDIERVMCYRALSFSRRDLSELPGVEEKRWVLRSNYHHRKFEEIIDEYITCRNATLVFFSGLSKEQLAEVGTANNMKFSVKALVYIIAGHELHHINGIKKNYPD